jgi:type IV secretion system protein VirB4
LAVCGASSPEDQKLIERTLESLPPMADPTAFVRALLAAKGLTGVDDLFDALTQVAPPANDAGAPISNDLTSPILGGYVHVAH